MVVLATDKSLTSLQSRKQDLVRQEIWWAAIDLFVAQGFDQTTADQIASAAAVSRRTFFRYFSSKEDVMSSVVRRYGAELSEAIALQPKDTNALTAAMNAIKSVVEPHLHLARRVQEIARASSAARMAQFVEVPLLEETLAIAFARRERRKSVALEHRLLASLTLSATGCSVEQWLANEQRPFQQVVDTVFVALDRIIVQQDRAGE